MSEPTRRSVESGVRVTIWLIAASLSCLPMLVNADQRIGEAGKIFMANGRSDLACTDLIIGGVLTIDQGTYVNVRNVRILAGGVLNGGPGSLAYSGEWVLEPGGEYFPNGLTVVRDLACAESLFADGFEDVTTKSSLGRR